MLLDKEEIIFIGHNKNLLKIIMRRCAAKITDDNKFWRFEDLWINVWGGADALILFQGVFALC